MSNENFTIQFWEEIKIPEAGTNTTEYKYSSWESKNILSWVLKEKIVAILIYLFSTQSAGSWNSLINTTHIEIKRILLKGKSEK